MADGPIRVEIAASVEVTAALIGPDGLVDRRSGDALVLLGAEPGQRLVVYAEPGVEISVDADTPPVECGAQIPMAVEGVLRLPLCPDRLTALHLPASRRGVALAIEAEAPFDAEVRALDHAAPLAIGRSRSMRWAQEGLPALVFLRADQPLTVDVRTAAIHPEVIEPDAGLVVEFSVEVPTFEFLEAAVRSGRPTMARAGRIEYWRDEILQGIDALVPDLGEIYRSVFSGAHRIRLVATADGPLPTRVESHQGNVHRAEVLQTRIEPDDTWVGDPLRVDARMTTALTILHYAVAAQEALVPFMPPERREATPPVVFRWEPGAVEVSPLIATEDYVLLSAAEETIPELYDTPLLIPADPSLITRGVLLWLIQAQPGARAGGILPPRNAWAHGLATFAAAYVHGSPHQRIPDGRLEPMADLNRHGLSARGGVGSHTYPEGRIDDWLFEVQVAGALWALTRHSIRNEADAIEPGLIFKTAFEIADALEEPNLADFAAHLLCQDLTADQAQRARRVLHYEGDCAR